MPGQASSMRTYHEEQIDSYRLDRRHLSHFLRHTFGSSRFSISEIGDRYIIHMPRLLSREEKTTIVQLRGRLHRQDESWLEADSTSSDQLQDSSELKLNTITQDVDGRRLDEGSIPTFIDGEPIQLKKHEVKRTSNDLAAEWNQFLLTRSDATSSGASGLIYQAFLSKGMSSRVYEAKALWNFNKHGIKRQRPLSSKVAVKRLSSNLSMEQFLQEYKALKTAARGEHSNIVDFLQAFRYIDINRVVYYNFCFPLAVGSLKQLFLASFGSQGKVVEIPSTQALDTKVERLSSDFLTAVNNTLWSEFCGLASAVRFLHDECQLVHSDIKPSNILLYWHDDGKRVVAKIADFGLAIDIRTRLTWQLGTLETMSATAYAAPELRQYLRDIDKGTNRGSATVVSQPSIANLKAGDIWKLGAVFTEMLSFLIMGGTGVGDFRSHITTVNKELTSDSLSDTRFDDGVQVKEQVIEWLERLSEMDAIAATIVPRVLRMLRSGPQRPTARELHHLFLTGTKTVYSGRRVIQILTPQELSPLSISDRIKERIETVLKQPVHWWPLENGKRTCLPTNSRLRWKYNSRFLEVDIPTPLANAFGLLSVPVFGQVAAGAGTTAATSGQGPPRSSTNSMPNPPADSAALSPAPSTGTSSISSAAVTGDRSILREIYWCVDKAWTQPKYTKLCSVSDSYHLDDQTLCAKLKQEYLRVRTWKGSILSWKSCLGVKFVHFSRRQPGRDQVFLMKHDKLPPVALRQLYDFQEIIPEDVHVKMVAEEIIAAMYHPEEASGSKRAISGIPRKASGQHQILRDDWGIYAVSYISLWKVLAWLIGLTMIGLGFVIFWLVYISATDLQNAFVPVTFMATMIMAVLGVPQLLNLD